LMQRVESGPLISPFAAADPVILINLVDLPAGTLGDLPQLALLIGRGLVDCGNPEIESGAFHGKSPHLSADTVSDLSPQNRYPQTPDFIDRRLRNFARVFPHKSTDRCFRPIRATAPAAASASHPGSRDDHLARRCAAQTPF